MRRVILESPYAAPTPEGIEANVAYARACLRDCLGRGEAPLASHLLYTQPGVLDDRKPEERALGIEAGLAWADTFVCEGAVFYTDRGGRGACWPPRSTMSRTGRRSRNAACWASVPASIAVVPMIGPARRQSMSAPARAIG